MKLISVTFYLFLIFIPNHLLAQEYFNFGRFHSRAIFVKSDDKNCNAPLVIMVPGSGANGPEEMMPSNVTGDNKDHSIFKSFSDGLVRGHVGTLSIGKPGINFFTSWDKSKFFYDFELYQSLKWQDLIDNLSDAVSFAKTLPCVDPNKIVILGHSEGTQVAVDFTTQNPFSILSLILVGFSGESLKTTIDWQFFRRVIDSWLIPDVDINHDGYISKTEVKNWPEFRWDWKNNQNKISFEEIEQALRDEEQLQSKFKKLLEAKIWEGVIDRPAIYPDVARLNQDIFVFTGEFDVQTRSEEAMELQQECTKQEKINCYISIVPGLGHGMSEPKEPRKQQLLDATLGPVSPRFQDLLEITARKIFKN